MEWEEVGPDRWVNVCASCAGVGGLKEGAYKVREVGVLEMSLVYNPADWGGVYSLESR